MLPRPPKKRASPGVPPLVAPPDTMSVRQTQERRCPCHSRSMLYVALVAATAWSDVLKKFSVVSTPFGSVERKSHPATRPRTARRQNPRVAVGEVFMARPEIDGFMLTGLRTPHPGPR